MSEPSFPFWPQGRPRGLCAPLPQKLPPAGLAHPQRRPAFRREHGAWSRVPAAGGSAGRGLPLCPWSARAVLWVLSTSHWTAGPGPRRGPWDPSSHRGQVWLYAQCGRIFCSCCCACCLLTREPASPLPFCWGDGDGSSVRAPASLPCPRLPRHAPCKPPRAVPVLTYQLRVLTENTAVTSFGGDGPPRQPHSPAGAWKRGDPAGPATAYWQPAATSACAQDPPAPGALSQGRYLCSNSSQCR